MYGHAYRSDICAEVLPGWREGLLGGGSMSLVTLRLLDAPSIVDEHDQQCGVPGAFTDLRPSEARRLADELPDCAQHAEALRRERTTDRLHLHLGY